MKKSDKKTVNLSALFKDTELTLDIEPETFSLGESIVSPDSAGRLGFMLSGRAAAVSLDKQTVLNVFEKGDCFGAAGLFGDGEICTHIIAKTACKVLFISEEQVENLIKTDGIFAKNYICFLSDRIRFLNLKISLFSLSDGTSRLARYLSVLSDDSVEVSFAKLSLMLSLSRATLYRALDKLESDGVIRRDKGKIQITKRKSLSEYF